MKAKHAIFAVNVLLIAVLSCNLSAAPTTGKPDLAGTITAQALTLQAPTGTPSLASSTPTITPTLTPSVPQVSVSSPTNCRTGQGANFDLVFTMNPGQTAEVVGKDTPDNYWIIKNPAGGTCWLWGQYATVTGDVAGIPDVAPLPTPTPSIPAAPKDFNVTFKCTLLSGPAGGWDVHVDLTWTDVAKNEDGYHVFREDALLATLATDATNFSDDTTTATFAPPITYSIEAFNGTGKSKAVKKSISCFP